MCRCGKNYAILETNQLPKYNDATLKAVESSPTTGPIGEKAPIIEASLVQVLSSSSEGGDHDIGLESTLHNASKSVHVVEEEVQAASRRQSCHLRRFLLSKVSFLFHSYLFLSKI